MLCAGAIDYGLKKTLDRMARLRAQILRQPRLAQPRRLKQSGQRRDTLWRCQREHKAKRVRHDVAIAPAIGRVDRNGDMTVRPDRITHQHSEFLAVGQQTQPLLTGTQHPKSAARRAEPIGAAGVMRRIEISAGSDSPGPQPGAAWRVHQPPTVLCAFARDNGILPNRRGEPEA